jgi:hypothetical protein
VDYSRALLLCGELAVALVGVGPGLDAVRRALEPQFAVPVVVRNPDAGPGTQVAVPRVDAGVDDSDSSVGAAAVASLPGVGRVS